MKKIKLNIAGISYSHSQSGSYALVLGEESGNRRLPIIIGSNEAQAIAIKVEGMTTTRPLTHDLFKTVLDEFNIALIEVFIYKLEEGVFYSKLICNNGLKDIEIDSRTSDAIAIALRAEAPIFTTESILKSAGIVMDEEGEKTEDESNKIIEKEIESISAPVSKKPDFGKYSVKELMEMLDKAINEEAYEKASQIRDELNLRKKGD
jgi:bifunctional DNase/RNase